MSKSDGTLVTPSGCLSGTSCHHCGLPTGGATACRGMVADAEYAFCCGGCLSVCQAIHDAGLDGFYARVKQREAELEPPPDMPSDMDQYDLDEVQQDMILQHANGRREALLLVEGIHCAACIWLIEKGLKALPGIEFAEVNLARQRLRVVWKEGQVQLSAIMQRLAALGYAALPYNQESAEGQQKRQNRSLLFRMGFAAFGAMNIMWISIALYAGAFSSISAEYRNFFHWVSFVIATPVLLYSGGPFLTSAWRGLIRLRLSMDLPIAIGALVTFAYSLWQTINHGEHVYFDTVVTFLFVILVGRYLEALARRNASSASLRLMELQPRMATRLTADGEQRVAIRKLVAGDRVLVRAGDKLPVDGEVAEGESHLDESMLTGESMPVHKKTGDVVAAGTVNLDAPLVVVVRQTGSGTTLARIIHLVEAAQGSKARVQRLADQIVPWFVAVTLGLAALTFAYWIDQDINTALLAAAAVLIITCPCALGLATPMAIAVSSGVGARAGVLVRNGEALERLSAIDHVVFDKTGTLTEGRMRVIECTSISEHMDSDDVLQLAAAIERHFPHPLSRAITDEAERRKLKFLSATGLQAVPGMGVSGDVQGKSLCLGNARLLAENGISLAADQQRVRQHIEADMGICVWLAVDGRLSGFIHLQDKLRDGAAEVLALLHREGIAATLLTGDSEQAAACVQQKLGDMQVVAGVLPEEKAQAVMRLREQGKKVLMVGDGVNDAPALAVADVSIAMGSGADVSMESADVVLMGSDIGKVFYALMLGRQTLKTVRQNLGLSLAYNILLVPAAMAALVTPVFAAIAMPLSSLLVIGNAMLIRRRMAGQK
ncbi:MAG: heavy metal translocating P-type ATPase [Mariprofundaceae bacterium]|nr:heavy metal translocating P-type ATPase [Mariprofundaceae bacterium]